MARASYYRDQANLLLWWALATSNAEHQALLRGRARKLLAQAEVAETPEVDLNPLLDEFNHRQMVQPEQPRPARQQQQQAQPKKNK